MSRKVIEQLIDDLDGSEADETVTFYLDGTTYQIDLTEDNAAKLRATLFPYQAAARKLGRAEMRQHAAAPPRRVVSPNRGTWLGKEVDTRDRTERLKIRDWARGAGYVVGDKGRISEEIMTAYHERHVQEAVTAVDPDKTTETITEKATAVKAAARRNTRRNVNSQAPLLNFSVPK